LPQFAFGEITRRSGAKRVADEAVAAPAVFADAHAFADAVFTGSLGATEKRETVRADSGRASGERRARAGHFSQTARRNNDRPLKIKPTLQFGLFKALKRLGETLFRVNRPRFFGGKIKK